MFKKTMALTLTLVSFLASLAMAQDESQTSKMAAPKPTYMNVQDPVGWFPFLGLAGGYMSPNDDLLTEGVPGDLKLLGSYFSEGRHSVFDFGLGFMAQSFTQKSEVENNFISGGIAEMAWRYNSTGRWQIGPIVDAYIGGGDRFGSTDPTWTSFAGLQLMKEFPVKNSNMFRVGLKALTDLSIPDAAINTVSLDLQWGFGSEQAAPQVGETESEATRDVAATETTSDDSMRSDLTGAEAAAAAAGTAMVNSRRVIETDPANNAVILRNDARMQFDTGSTTLAGVNSSFVEKLGSTLSERSDLFDKVEVIGFADQTGSRPVNMRVSKARSAQVAQQLETGGLAADKIERSWKGSEDPLYKSLLPEDMQQNRRVDLKFHGVKDQTALQDLLNNL